MRDVKPFFVPGPDHIRASAWSHLVDEEWEPLGAYVENWDYRSRLLVRCTLDADVAAVRTATRLHDGSPLAWSIGWRATDTGLLGDPTIIDLTPDPVSVELDVPAERAGATIVLTRRLVLRRDRINAAAGEPRWAGSILWTDDTAVRLTGQGAAFPSEVVDFREYGRDPATSWYLELPAAADVPAMGSLILLINAADKELVAAVSRSRRHTDAQLALLHSMEEGVVEALVHWALARWTELDDVEPDSVGAAARTLTARVLPDPAAWTDADIDRMELTSAIIGGARRIGYGRSLG